MGRVPDQPHGLVTAPGEQALQQQRDLAVAASDDNAHAASLPAGEPAKRAAGETGSRPTGQPADGDKSPTYSDAAYQCQ